MRKLERKREHVNLIGFLYDNVDLLHPEIVELIEPALQVYKGLRVATGEFLDVMKTIDAKWGGRRKLTHGILRGNKLKAPVSIGYKTVNLDLNNYVYYLLMSDCFDLNLFPPVSNYLAGYNSWDRHIEVFEINEINQALTQGLDAWNDAVYLHTYRKLYGKEYTFHIVDTNRTDVPPEAVTLLIEGFDFYFNTRAKPFVNKFAAEAFIAKVGEIIQRGKELEANIAIN